MATRTERRERITKLRKHAKRIRANGLAPTFEPMEAAAFARMLMDILEDKGARRAARFLNRLLDKSLEAASTPRVACHGGCWWCCHSFVPVSLPEALILAEAARERGFAPESVAAVADKTRDLDADARLRARIPCAFLNGDGACGVYEDRPIACRTLASLSAESCRTAWEAGDGEAPSLEAFDLLRASANAASWAAMKALGLDRGAVELNHAVRTVLEAPDAETRWLAGERIFEGGEPDGAEEALLDILIEKAGG